MKTSLPIVYLVLVSLGAGCGQDQKINSSVGTPLSKSDTTLERPDTAGATPKPQVSELLQQSSKAISGIEDASDRAVFLAQVALVLAKSGDRSSSAKLFRSAIEIADTVELSHGKAYTLQEIALAQAEAGAVKDALKTAASLGAFKDPYIDEIDHPAAYASIAIAQAEAGDVNGAFDTANRISDANWKAFALSQLATVQSRSGDFWGATSTFKEATASARLVPDRSLRVCALADVSKALTSVGDSVKAHRLIDEALQIAQAEPDESLRTGALVFLTDAQAECGDVAGLLETVAAIKKEEFSRNLRWAASEAKAGNLVNAVRIVTSSRLGNLEGMILNTIAVAHTKAGDFHGALEIAQSIEEQDWQDIALGGIVTAQVERNDLNRAYETCLTIQGDFWKSRALLEVASAHKKAGTPETASRLLKKAQLAASTVDADSTIFREVADGHAAAGYVSEMLEWAEELTSPKAKANVFLGLAEGLLSDD